MLIRPANLTIHQRTIKGEVYYSIGFKSDFSGRVCWNPVEKHFDMDCMYFPEVWTKDITQLYEATNNNKIMQCFIGFLDMQDEYNEAYSRRRKKQDEADTQMRMYAYQLEQEALEVTKKKRGRPTKRR